MKSQKNAVIELLRFLFASSIVLYHIASKDLKFAKETLFTIGPWKANFFRMGNIGVEFFYLVTGYLMAASVYKKLSGPQTNNISIGEETAAYVFRKAKAVYPHYLSACVLIAVLQLISGKGITSILKNIPSLLFLQRTGISEDSFVSITWYISSMLIAIALIYPFLKRYYYTFTALVAPLGGILLIGMLIKNTGNLFGTSDWMLVTYKCNLRAVAEIALGTVCFDICRRMQNIEFTRLMRAVFTITVLGFLIFSCVYMWTVASQYNGVFVLMMCFVITIVFSRKGIWGDSDALYGSKLFCYLGSISMPIFLYQNIFRNLYYKFLRGASRGTVISLVYLGTVIFSVIMNELINRILKRLPDAHRLIARKEK